MLIILWLWDWFWMWNRLFFLAFLKIIIELLGTILRLHWHLSILWCQWFTSQWVLPIFLLPRLNLTHPPSLGSGLFAASSKRKRRGAALSPPSARQNSISPHLTHRLPSLLLDFIYSLFFLHISVFLNSSIQRDNFSITDIPSLKFKFLNNLKN